jgi:hypothetical protein
MQYANETTTTKIEREPGFFEIEEKCKVASSLEVKGIFLGQ